MTIRTLFVLLLVLAAAAGARAQGAGSDPKAEAVLAKAVDALGGQKYLQVRTLYATGKFSIIRDGILNRGSIIVRNLLTFDEVERLRAIVSDIVAEGTPAYRSALALQDYFRKNFTYSLDVSPIESSQATLEFLERRSGYCEHFASTFALFARILGLPSRVAIGFTPGDSAANDSGVAVYTVRPMHAHAWPEVWFDGLGWVLFEPTPGRGAPNSEYTNVPEEQAVEPPSPTTTVPLSPTTTVPSNLVSPSTTAVIGTSADSLEVPGSGAITWPWILLVSIIGAIAAWTIALPRVCRLVVERRSDAEILRLWRRAVALYELER